MHRSAADWNMKKLKLTGEALFPFLHGVLSMAVAEDGSIRMNRFTSAQLERYAFDGTQKSKDYVARCAASSGITLEMVTDSSFLGMTFKLLPAIRPDFIRFDCFVDGRLWETHPGEPDTIRASFSLPAGTHTVTVFFPWCVAVALNSVVLEKGASVVPSEKSYRLLALGDSITQGYSCVHPSCCYTNRVAAVLNAELLNQAVSGYWFQAESLDDVLIEQKPDAILIAYGTNDYVKKESARQFSGDAEAYMARLCAIFPDTPVLAIMPIFRADQSFYDMQILQEFTPEESFEMLRSVYRKYPNVKVLEDTYFPHSIDFLDPDDHLHPNDLGSGFYADAVLSALKPLLK